MKRRPLQEASTKWHGVQSLPCSCHIVVGGRLFIKLGFLLCKALAAARVADRRAA